MAHLKEKPPVKVYDGPFGSYPAGSVGAVLNAACRQENRSSCAVSSWVIGDGVLWSDHSKTKVVATYRWDGDDIIFEWN